MSAPGPPTGDCPALCEKCGHLYGSGLRGALHGDLLLVKASATPAAVNECPKCGGAGKIVPIEAHVLSEILALLLAKSSKGSLERLVHAIESIDTSEPHTSDDLIKTLQGAIPEHHALMRRLRHTRGDFYALLAAIAAIAQLWLTIYSSGRQPLAVGGSPGIANSGVAPESLQVELQTLTVKNASSHPLGRILEFRCGLRVRGNIPEGRSLVGVGAFDLHEIREDPADRDGQLWRGRRIEVSVISDSRQSDVRFEIWPPSSTRGQDTVDLVTVEVGLCRKVGQEADPEVVEGFSALARKKWVRRNSPGGARYWVAIA